MHASPRLRRGLRLGLAALTLALNAAVVLVPGQAAQAQSAGQGGGCGQDDYPIPGGWFYTQEAHGWAPVTGQGPCRWRGYEVVDNDQAAFWTEFRRYGGVDVLGYPVSQPYHYPVGNPGGYWYQAFERGILQWHPESQRAEMANVFDQFSENGLDPALHHLGIPEPQDVGSDPEQHMALLAEPQFVARYFYDPVAFHSSDPDRSGEATYATQEQAWTVFGLPQSTAQRLNLTGLRPGAEAKPKAADLLSLYPLAHNFYAQRFQKAGLELFVETGAETYPDQPVNLDPTIVPGDGRPGCVVLTATGLLARTLGAGQLIPTDRIPPTPMLAHEPAHFTAQVPPVAGSESTVNVQLSGAGFGPNEPITISFAAGQPTLAPVSTSATSATPGTPAVQMPLLLPGGTLPAVTVHTTAYPDGSFGAVISARLGLYTVTVSGDNSKSVATDVVNTSLPSVQLVQNSGTSTGCGSVGLPTWN